MKIAFRLLILLAAIQTYADSSIDTLKNKLDGRWEWVETSGGYSGKQYTPQSMHYSLTLLFSKNVPQQRSDSIWYQVYRNDTIILLGFTATSLVNMPAFGPGNLIKGSVFGISDTLLLGTLIMDGYSSVFLRSRTSGPLVRGIISDSATGAPIGNVKVVLMLMAGEIDLILDSTRTGTTGGYAFSNRSGSGLYIYTISDRYYYQSTSIAPVGIDDTITKDIKLKRIPTMVSATPDSRALQSRTVRMAKSRLYLSGIEAGAFVGIYDLNGRLLLRAAVPAVSALIKR
jgi:hypothetical protein